MSAAPRLPVRHGSGFELCTIAGIRIAVDASWVLIYLLVLWSLAAGYFPQAYPGNATVLYWTVGAIGALLFFASIVVHELAHALVANRFGQDVRRITLFIFGGTAHLSREPDSARIELAVAAVGPLTSLLLGAACAAVARYLPALGIPLLWVGMVRYLAVANIAVAVFNLLPGLPLDGGRVLRAVYWLRSGDLRAATARAADWGIGIGLGLTLVGVLQLVRGDIVGGLWAILIGMFLRGAAQGAYAGMMLEQVLGRTRVHDLMVPEPVIAVPADLSIARAAEDYFLRYGFGGFPVADDGRLVGIVSLGDLTRCPPAERGARVVRDVMQPAAAVQISADDSATSALRRMAESERGRLLVVDRGGVIGLVTQTAITRFLKVTVALGEDRAAPPG